MRGVKGVKRRIEKMSKLAQEPFVFVEYCDGCGVVTTHEMIGGMLECTNCCVGEMPEQFKVKDVAGVGAVRG